MNGFLNKLRIDGDILKFLQGHPPEDNIAVILVGLSQKITDSDIASCPIAVLHFKIVIRTDAVHAPVKRDEYLCCKICGNRNCKG